MILPFHRQPCAMSPIVVCRTNGVATNARLMTTLARLAAVLRSKLLQALPTVLAIVILNFLLLQLPPGGVADVLAGESVAANAESMAAFRAYFPLDLPILHRLLDY